MALQFNGSWKKDSIKLPTEYGVHSYLHSNIVDLSNNPEVYNVFQTHILRYCAPYCPHCEGDAGDWDSLSNEWVYHFFSATVSTCTIGLLRWVLLC